MGRFKLVQEPSAVIHCIPGGVPPPFAQRVVIWCSIGKVLGARYGGVWRDASDGAELIGVYAWAELSPGGLEEAIPPATRKA